ncbi:glucanase B [Xylariaceae sp. FL0594]|nr:glucanase B [Xylariaceae sp. FL0594]
MTSPTTQIAFRNNTGSSTAYAYVTGRDINRGSAYAFMRPDGKTMYYPTSPPQPQSPLAIDPSIPLGPPGTTTTVTIPQLAGGRIWFSVGAKLTFLLNPGNPGPGIVEPAVTNKSDLNYNIKHEAWIMPSYDNQQQLFVNISYVDFVSLPIALDLLNTAGKVQSVKGLPVNGLDQICAQLTQQGAVENPGWAKLVVKGPDGKNLRALSPNSGHVVDNTLFQGYYQPYVDQAWAKYTSTDLHIDTQAQWGVVTGRVDSKTNLLTFNTTSSSAAGTVASAGSFAKPSAGDIFSCSTGPFGNYPLATRDVQGAIGARLAAALNRSTLLANPNQPTPSSSGSSGKTYYYQLSPTNHYARIVHGVNLDGRGYAFPYDDVAASGDNGPDQAGTVFDGSPRLLTVTVGGPAPSSNSARAVGGKKDVEKGREEKKNKGLSFPAVFLKRMMSALRGIFHKSK